MQIRACPMCVPAPYTDTLTQAYKMSIRKQINQSINQSITNVRTK